MSELPAVSTEPELRRIQRRLVEEIMPLVRDATNRIYEHENSISLAGGDFVIFFAFGAMTSFLTLIQEALEREYGPVPIAAVKPPEDGAPNV